MTQKIPAEQTPEQSKSSRLEPQPIPRRDFLGDAAKVSCAAALAAAGLGMLRLPKAAVLPSPSAKFKVSLPESLSPGEPFVPQGKPVVVIRDDKGVFALSLVCTHLGCIVKPSSTGFDCPCHGSRFSPDGKVIKGPAPRSLHWLAVKALNQQDFMVDLSQEVPPDTRVVA